MADILNNLNSANYITVKVTDNPIINGNNLLDAYRRAKTVTPNNSALSSSNRLGIILPPAIYDLGTKSLTLDTQYIDIIGSTNERNKHHIKSDVTTVSSGTVRQTANDVKLINLKIENIGQTGLNFDDTDPAAYFPNTNLNNTYIENVEFIGNLAIANFGTYSMRRSFYAGIVTYSGTFINCVGGKFAFAGGDWGIASGTFIGCTGGDYSFASQGTASGTFKNCTGGYGAFGGIGGIGYATGTFENCVGGGLSFGGGGSQASGTFINCVGGIESFGGGGGLVFGTFINCRGGTDSFVGFNFDW